MVDLWPCCSVILTTLSPRNICWVTCQLKFAILVDNPFIMKQVPHLMQHDCQFTVQKYMYCKLLNLRTLLNSALKELILALTTPPMQKQIKKYNEWSSNIENNYLKVIKTLNQMYHLKFLKMIIKNIPEKHWEHASNDKYVTWINQMNRWLLNS